ncbi:MAG TPA: hypothetical protein VE377_07780 [Candidatus Dormibacteraeota bacterium]|nr:hypothetical protein [Candidatus Dormibacteraeota bacterium]
MIEWLRTWAETIEHVTVALASIIGGVWVLFRFFNERTLESALTIDIDASLTPVDGKLLTFVDVKLSNVGKVRLQAKPADPSENAYDDKVETLKYSCSLRLKKLLSLADASDAVIDWFKDKNVADSSLGEINLLNEYEDPENHYKVDFWMEPGEVYHLGVPLVLSPAVYLAKVTFVGDRCDKEFWSRIVVVRVQPTP